MSRDIHLARPLWAWGRNRGFAPAVVSVSNMGGGGWGETPEPEVWLSIYSQRGFDRGTSPIDIHLTHADALAVAAAWIAPATDGQCATLDCTSPANVVGSIYCADCNGLTEPLEADRV